MRETLNRPRIVEEVKLTSFSHGAGWACKIGPRDLAQVLCYLPPVSDPNVLVGRETMDDGAVYRLSDDLAIVQTVDYITPVVDDPYSFGAIAAANALSDIYAMGARPITALNLVGYPAKTLPLSILGEILRGGGEKMAEAGVSVVGGHSIDDHEPKYGLAVTGVIHPDRIVTNAGARPGDALILTKPLGTGIITTGIDRRLVDEQTIAKVTALMAALNQRAAEVMVKIGVNACTDISGFGLLGHLHEMAAGSKVGARVTLKAIPILSEVWDLVQAGIAPEGSHNNHRYFQEYVSWDSLTREEQLVLCDAQTSGGLLIAVPPERQESLLLALAAAGVPEAVAIGEMVEDRKGRIWVE